METRIRLIFLRAVLGHCRKFGTPVWAIIADQTGGFFKQFRYC